MGGSAANERVGRRVSGMPRMINVMNLTVGMITRPAFWEGWRGCFFLLLDELLNRGSGELGRVTVRPFIPRMRLLFLFFIVEISSRPLIALFMPGSVHSGSAS